MSSWPTWTPPSPPAVARAAPTPSPRRRLAPWAIAGGVLQLGAIAAHLAVAAHTPSPRPRELRMVVVPAPPVEEARGLGGVFPGITRAADPGAGREALLRSYDRVAVNPAQPEVILAWSLTELAFTADDGASWTRHTLPGTDGTDLPVGTVTPDGGGLLSLGLQGWLHVRRGGVQRILPPFGGVVSRFAANDRWIVALLKEPDDLMRTIHSVDRGGTWRRGPDAPRGSTDLLMLPDGRAAVSYAYDTSCGGGSEGVLTLRPGETDWSTADQRFGGHLGPDLHVVTTGCDEHRPESLCAWPPGRDPKPSIGPAPSLPAGLSPWFASGTSATYVGGGSAIRRVERGVFTEVEVDAPVALRDVVVDGRDRLVGIVNGHIVRWTPKAAGNRGDWQVHLP